MTVTKFSSFLFEDCPCESSQNHGSPHCPWRVCNKAYLAVPCYTATGGIPFVSSFKLCQIKAYWQTAVNTLIMTQL